MLGLEGAAVGAFRCDAGRCPIERDRVHLYDQWLVPPILPHAPARSRTRWRRPQERPTTMTKPTLPFEDSVTHDLDALALHMRSCAKARGRLQWLLAALEGAQALVAPRLVTSVAVVLVVFAGGLLVM